MGIEFRWCPEYFSDIVESCSKDDATPYVLKYMPRNGIVVEAGCM